MKDATPYSARVGSVIQNHWVLERLLGVGGMAAVYAARGPQQEEVAIKILHPDMSQRKDVRERFLKEAYVSNQIPHPGVVRVLGNGTELVDGAEQAFLVMELLQGETLGDYARRHGAVPLALLLDVLEQLLEILVAAHQQGVVHRDLKPQNLMLLARGEVKVLDFGVARTLLEAPGDFKTRTGVALGTLAYMAPEQALGRREDIDGRTDLFAVGATFFRLLTGRYVHQADSEAELLAAMATKPAPALRSVAPDVPVHAAAVIDLALAFSKNARYPSAQVMLEDVRALRLGAPPPYASARLAERETPTLAESPSANAAPGTSSPAPPPAAPPPAAPPSPAPDAAPQPSTRGVRTQKFGTVPPVSERGTVRLPARPPVLGTPSPTGGAPNASLTDPPTFDDTLDSASLAGARPMTPPRNLVVAANSKPPVGLAVFLLVAASALAMVAAWFVWQALSKE